jgi:hypothetical protein
VNCLTRGCPPPRDGSRRCHCAACHLDFSGLTAFDKHQTLDHGSHCHDPATRGLVRRSDGVWRTPGEMPGGLFPPSGDDTDGLNPATLGASVGPEATDAHRAAL